MIHQKQAILRKTYIISLLFFLHSLLFLLPASASQEVRWGGQSTMTIQMTDEDQKSVRNARPSVDTLNIKCSSQGWGITRNVFAGLTATAYLATTVLKGVTTFSPDPESCDLNVTFIYNNLTYIYNNSTFIYNNGTVLSSPLSQYTNEIEFALLLLSGSLMILTGIATVLKEKKDDSS